MKITKKELREYWGKFWYLLWEDNSWKGWVFSIVFLFLFIKLIFFPGLSLVTGTSLPLAIVESCSMYHDGNLFSDYDSWWDKHDKKYETFDLEKEIFETFIFNNGFNKGDILFIVGINPRKLEVGDVIIFNGEQKNPIIHRVVGIEEQDGKRIFSTIGDNSNHQLITEKEISGDRLIGRAVFKVAPYVGWGKLIFFEASRPPTERGLCSEN
ncbi:signal peptidase I [Candidatus Pacearchaeota archaeon]|nr:signal peptidase I [Candidatus Pacearchaeota archaeon]